MKINIQSLHFKATSILESFVQQKVSKLALINDSIIAGDVCLKLDHADNRENKICEVRIHIPGHDLFAMRQSRTFEEATNEAVDAMQEQLRKKKA